MSEELQQIDNEINKIIPNIPLKLKEQHGLLKDMFVKNNNLMMLGGKLKALDANGIPRNEDLEEIVTYFAIESGFILSPEALSEIHEMGDLNTLKGKSFGEVMQEAGIKPNTDESDELYRKWNKANRKCSHLRMRGAIR